MPLTIGIDYGGVCSKHDANNEDKYEDDNFVGEVGINVPDCLEILRYLKSLGHTLILISYCGVKRANETKKYFRTLQNNPFSELFFVKKRAYKKEICAYRGVDVMIDNRLDILATIAPTYTMHFGSHMSDVKSKYIADYTVKNWQEVQTIFSAGSKGIPFLTSAHFYICEFSFLFLRFFFTFAWFIDFILLKDIS